jgi:hypothetical protein
MSARYPAEGEETGATAESTTPYIHRDPEGGQDPQPPTPTQPEEPDEGEAEPAKAG